MNPNTTTGAHTDNTAGVAALPWRWYALAIGVIAADQLSKLAVLKSLVQGQWVYVTSYFNIVLAFNRGAAFSFLDQASNWQQYVFLGIALVVSGFIAHALRKGGHSLLMNLALSFIMGGALGNGLDRLRLNHVVDFLDFHWALLSGLFPAGHFPAFNLADSAITLGVILLIADELVRAKQNTQGR